MRLIPPNPAGIPGGFTAFHRAFRAESRRVIDGQVADEMPLARGVGVGCGDFGRVRFAARRAPSDTYSDVRNARVTMGSIGGRHRVA